MINRCKNLTILCGLLSLFLVANSHALIIDTLDETQDEVVSNGTRESWASGLTDAVGGCRKLEITETSTGTTDRAKGTFINKTYSHSQDDGVTATSIITWGVCEDGSTMDPVDLTIDGSNYISVIPGGTEAGGDICLKLTDSSNKSKEVCKTVESGVSEYQFLNSEFGSGTSKPDLTKIKKIEFAVDGSQQQSFDFSIIEIKTGSTDPAVVVCNVVPSDNTSYGAKDECGLCPEDSDYGKGKDECNFCPNDTLPDNYQYGDGKICKGTSNEWCPTVAKPGKAGGYTCTECDDGVDNDGDGKIDYDGGDPECDSITDDTEAPACSDGIDNDGDGKTDAQDPGCKDENGNYDPNKDDEGDPQCADGKDNDGDGRIDAKDPACYDKNPATGQYEYNPQKNSEDGPNTECSDGQDNDADNYIDEEDPGCWYPDSKGNGGTKDYSSYPFGEWNPWDTSEGPNYQCSDGLDNDEDGEIDAEDSGCIDKNGKWNPRDNSELTSSKKPECNDGKDNDGDGKIDFPNDPGCSGPDDDSEKTLPECSDGKDNDGDGKIDSNDPECYTDGKYDPEKTSESPCTNPSGSDSVSMDNKRLAEIGLNAAAYLKKFYNLSSAEYKRTALSAKRVGTKVTKQIKTVTTELTKFNIVCDAALGTTCRSNNDAELNAFAKNVATLNKLVRRAQRRGLFFKKNYETKAITAKKRKNSGFQKARTNMLNSRKAKTREKLVKSLNSNIAAAKSMAICS